MPVRTAFAAGNFAIELEGVSAGFVKSAQGGGASGEVVVEESGTDGIAHKHLAGVKYEPIIVTFPIGSTSAFLTWIADTLARKYSSKSGAVITTDFDFKERSRLNFFNAFISEITFPALDVGSKDAGLLSVELSPELNNQLWVPVGFGHAFCSLEANTVISYRVTNYYSPEHDKGVAWDDPDIAVRWPSVADPETLSVKDRQQPSLSELPAYFSMENN